MKDSLKGACPWCLAPRRALDGAKVRKERLRLGLSQREVASRAGISPSMLCDVEFGRRRLSRVREACLLAALR